jgi:dynein heavy chain
VIWTKWKLKDQNTVVPCPRSGHTLTLCRSSYIIFGGTINGLLDLNIKKICATNELWTLDLYNRNLYGWTKQSPKGDIPTPRSNHIAVTLKEVGANDNSAMILIHGGMNDKGKLDDTYLLDPVEMKFTKINTGDNCPSPRANHAATYFEGKVYLFGGNGGRSYENQIFKDLWVFSLTTKQWEEIKFQQEGKFLFKF